MDNRTIDILSEGEESLALAIKLTWPNAPGGKAVAYKIARLKKIVKYHKNSEGEVLYHSSEWVEAEDGIHSLILFWHHDPKSTPLPYPINLDGAIEFIKGWLDTAEYGKQPDHDGDNHPGWRLFNESWGHVFGSCYGILMIQPAWAMYGK
jgi:hypothetical protein